MLHDGEYCWIKSCQTLKTEGETIEPPFKPFAKFHANKPYLRDFMGVFPTNAHICRRRKRSQCPRPILDWNQFSSMVIRAHYIPRILHKHYNGVIMGMIASQITSLTIVYSIVYSDADKKKHQSSASLAFVRGIHRGPVNSPRTNGQLRGKCYYLMTSSWSSRFVVFCCGLVSADLTISLGLLHWTWDNYAITPCQLNPEEYGYMHW